MKGSMRGISQALIDMNDPSFVKQIALEAFPTHDYRWKVAEWARLQVEEPTLTNIEVAARLGIAARTLRNYIQKAQAEGVLTIVDPQDRLEYEAIPAALDTLMHHVKGEQSLKAAIAVLKGTGRFKAHTAVKSETEVTQNIAMFPINLPANFTLDVPGVVGQGHVIEAEVIKREVVDVEPRAVEK